MEKYGKLFLNYHQKAILFDLFGPVEQGKEIARI